MLASLAMAVAVYVLSPVTMRTTMPALLQLLTASGIPSLRGSLIPAKPKTTKSFSKSYGLYSPCIYFAETTR